MPYALFDPCHPCCDQNVPCCPGLTLPNIICLSFLDSFDVVRSQTTMTYSEGMWRADWLDFFCPSDEPFGVSNPTDIQPLSRPVRIGNVTLRVFDIGGCVLSLPLDSNGSNISYIRKIVDGLHVGTFSCEELFPTDAWIVLAGVLFKVKIEVGACLTSPAPCDMDTIPQLFAASFNGWPEDLSPTLNHWTPRSLKVASDPAAYYDVGLEFHPTYVLWDGTCVWSGHGCMSDLFGLFMPQVPPTKNELVKSGGFYRYIARVHSTDDREAEAVFVLPEEDFDLYQDMVFQLESTDPPDLADRFKTYNFLTDEWLAYTPFVVLKAFCPRVGGLLRYPPVLHVTLESNVSAFDGLTFDAHTYTSKPNTFSYSWQQIEGWAGRKVLTIGGIEVQVQVSLKYEWTSSGLRARTGFYADCPIYSLPDVGGGSLIYQAGEPLVTPVIYEPLLVEGDMKSQTGFNFCPDVLTFLGVSVLNIRVHFSEA